SDLCRRIGRAIGRERVRVSPRAQELLAQCHWPGNVRELEDVLGRAIAFSSAPRIGRALIADVISEGSESIGALRASRVPRGRGRLLAELRATGGNVSHPALALGLSRAAVYRLIARHRIPLSWHRARRASEARAGRSSERGGDPRPGPRAGSGR